MRVRHNGTGLFSAVSVGTAMCLPLRLCSAQSLSLASQINPSELQNAVASVLGPQPDFSAAYGGSLDENDISVLSSGGASSAQMTPSAGSGSIVSNSAPTPKLTAGAVGPSAATLNPAIRSVTPVTPATTTAGATGDLKPDFVYNPQTGDLTFILDGAAPTKSGGLASFVTSLSVGSIHGLLIPGNVNPQMAGGTGATLTTAQLSSGLTNSPGYTDGVSTQSFDLGNVLPAGLALTDLVGDLSVKYQYFQGGVLKTSDVVLTPEPTGLGVVALLGLRLMARRRNKLVASSEIDEA